MLGAGIYRDKPQRGIQSMEQDLIKLLTELISSGSSTLIIVGILFVVAKYGTPVITAGIVFRGVRLIIKEVAQCRRQSDGPH